MNELFKLLDNNEIIKLRGDVQVDKSVSLFINLLFRSGLDQNSSQKAYHEDIVRLLKATELFTYIKNRIGDPYIRNQTLLPDNYWVTAYQKLKSSREVVSDMLFFYGGVYSSKGERDLLEFLKTIWFNHRNLVYRLGALIVIHLIGMKHLKDNLC